MRLVSQANPASRQYQPTNNGYPPPSSSSSSPYIADTPSNPQLMDPFFDDDDEPDSAFGRPMPMQSQESGLPLARHGAPHAGAGPSKVSLGDGVPQGWNFEDDDPHQVPRGETGTKKPPRPKKKWSWKWPWQKEKVLTGERVIALNNSAANAEFGNNFVSTSKYNLATFLPKFLLEQFSKYANLFFLFTACIQQIPDVSPTNQYTTIVPLGAVLAASAFKEAQEDLVRTLTDPLLRPPHLPFHRNATSQTRSSTQARQRSSTPTASSSRQNGRTSASATSSASRAMTSFPPT